MSFYAEVEKGTQITINNVACVADAKFKVELLDAINFDQAAELCNIAKLGTGHLDHDEKSTDGTAIHVTYGQSAERIETPVVKEKSETATAHATKAKPKG